ncbi:MAG: restriction endonuclease subunit S [Oscillospiraceae bacterium]
MSKWKKVKLGDILDYEQPTKYIVSNENYSKEYSIPVLTAGQTFVLGYTNEEENIYKNLPVIIFDDFTTSMKLVDFPFKVKSSAMKILKPTDSVDIKYIYSLMCKIKIDTQLHKRYWISQYSRIEVALPPLDEQKKIANKLDKITDIITKRKAQLEKLDLLVKSREVGQMRANGLEVVV